MSEHDAGSGPRFPFCARAQGSPVCAPESLREDFAEIAGIVARRLRRVGSTELPAGRLARTPARALAEPDRVFELQFERGYALLVAAATCPEHGTPSSSNARVTRAVAAYLNAAPALRVPRRKDVVVALDWATRDFGRFALAGTPYTSRPERKLAELRDTATGAALFDPVQIAVATVLIRGVAAFGERTAAAIVATTIDDASALGYLRRVTVAAYRSGISGVTTPVLLDTGDHALLTALAGLRRRESWRRGGDPALSIHTALLLDAGRLIAASVEAEAGAREGRPVFAADRDPGDLARLLAIRAAGYRLPDGRVATAAQRRIIDDLIDTLAT